MLQVSRNSKPAFADDRFSLDAILAIICDYAESATIQPEQLAELQRFAEWADACSVKVKFAFSKKRLREKLMEEDPHCRYCGRLISAGEASVDHYIPRAKGGANLPAKYKLVCTWCNGLKSSLMPEEFLELLRGIVSRVEAMIQSEEVPYEHPQPFVTVASARQIGSTTKSCVEQPE